jgi:hypothetical protein
MCLQALLISARADHKENKPKNKGKKSKKGKGKAADEVEAAEAASTTHRHIKSTVRRRIRVAMMNSIIGATSKR